VLILLEEKGVFRFAKMAAAVGAALCGIQGCSTAVSGTAKQPGR
jgi:hypothetical protein